MLFPINNFAVNIVNHPELHLPIISYYTTNPCFFLGKGDVYLGFWGLDLGCPAGTYVYFLTIKLVILGNLYLGGRKQLIYPGKIAYWGKENSLFTRGKQLIFHFALDRAKTCPKLKVKPALSTGQTCSKARQVFNLKMLKRYFYRFLSITIQNTGHPRQIPQHKKNRKTLV